MPYKSFLIPLRNAAWAEEELNDFVRSHRVLAVDRHWVTQGENSFWAVWVDYLEFSADRPAGAGGSVSKKKVDYKEVLSPEDFAVFAQLRSLRKELATEDAVALYTVFTNEQLAQMVQSRVQSQEALRQIAGIGEARVEKYGPRVLELLNKVWRDSDEAGGPIAEPDR